MALKPRQIKLAELMVDEPELTNYQYAEKIGCSETSIYGWKKLKEFEELYHSLCKKRFRSYESLAIKKLKENAVKGNQKAIEYLLSYIGYKPQEQAQIQMDANIQIDYGD